MKILYGKIGRSFNLDRANMSTLGGDVDVVNFLERLALSHPQDTIVIVSRNSGENPQAVGLPTNIENLWSGPSAEAMREESLRIKDVHGKMMLSAGYVSPEFETADAVVMWVGQHGTSNMPIPNVGTNWSDGVLTKPQDSFLNYVGFLIHGINRWRDMFDGQREEVWLLPDVRNYFKGRDLKWPLRETMLAQYDKTHQAKFERWEDPRPPGPLGFDAEWENSVWVSQVRQQYAGVELAAITDPFTFPLPDLEGRAPFGMLINENAKDRKPTRLDVMYEWVMPWGHEAELHGTWSEQSLKILGRNITPLAHGDAMRAMEGWRSTFTTPASGSGWATAKPWEAFLTGTICFFHPKYDDQDHILCGADPELRRFLRVKDPNDLERKVRYMWENDQAYEWFARMQRVWLEETFKSDHLGRVVHQRIVKSAGVK